MITRAEITVKGRVQKAGYRDAVEEAAFNLNLMGFVKNMHDKTVKIVCEGEKADIEKFLKKIKIHEFPISVEDVKAAYSKPTGEFTDFEIIREEDITVATYERLDSVVRYMRQMNSNLSEKMDSGNKTLAESIDSGNKMLAERMDSGNKMLAGKIEAMHTDMNRNFSEMGNRYEVIGTAVTEVLREFRKKGK